MHTGSDNWHKIGATNWCENATRLWSKNLLSHQVAGLNQNIASHSTKYGSSVLQAKRQSQKEKGKKNTINPPPQASWQILFPSAPAICNSRKKSERNQK